MPSENSKRGEAEFSDEAKLRKARSISPRFSERSWVMTRRRAFGLAASSCLHQRAQAASSDGVSAAR